MISPRYLLFISMISWSEIFPAKECCHYIGWFPEESRLNPVSLGSVLVLHGEPDMVGLLAVFVPHHHLVVTRVVVGQMSDGQGTVCPVPPPLQERLIFLIKVQSAQQRHLVLEPGCLVLRLLDQEGLQQHSVSLLSHPQLLSELRWSSNIFKMFL